MHAPEAGRRALSMRSFLASTNACACAGCLAFGMRSFLQIANAPLAMIPRSLTAAEH
ncbi:hypothetical protein CHCC20327_4904 [Bacillus licheniformis]|nr:hypothetical protein CHCC20487_2949 [Bacillus licheniformis]TWK34315.1 hypothetical protein CHCC20369_2325 [Bacillus licheniformis]TWK41833.1 hypothetical protein CHCC20368_4000 [Bacillus licheniformis]TWK90045.1 hypothetical protein CHCC20327_4904 [Bacillus licheniformis]